MENQEPQSTIVMGHIADIKEKLAKNTADTQNIKESLARIDDNLKIHNSLFVTHEEFKTLKENDADKEARLRILEKVFWKAVGALAILEVAIPLILHFIKW